MIGGVMPAISKYEKARNWIREYIKEYGEYNGTLDELAKLSSSSPYLIKKALSELEGEGILKAQSVRGKGLHIEFIKKEEQGEAPEEKKEAAAPEERREVEAPKEQKRKTSLQDEVLTYLLGKDIVVFLISGTRLEGKLLDFDNFTLSMTAPKGRSLVYKHAIATIIYE